MKVWKPQTAYSLGREAGWAPLMAEINACATAEALDALWTAFLLERHRHYPEGWTLAFRDACRARKAELMVSDEAEQLDAAYAATVGSA